MMFPPNAAAQVNQGRTPEQLAAQQAYDLQRNTAALEKLAQYAEMSRSGIQFAGQNARNEAAAGLATARLRLASAQAEADRQRTPAGQAMSRRVADAQVTAGGAESLNEQRNRVGLAEARARRAATPEGQAEFRERAKLARQEEGAGEKLAREKNIAEYGKVGGAAMNLWQSFAKGKAAMQEFALPLAAAQAAVLAFGYDTARAASPSSAKTFGTSQQILMAQIGQSFGTYKILDQGSFLMQQAADAIKNATKGGEGRQGRGDAALATALSEHGPIAMLSQQWFGKSLPEVFGMKNMDEEVKKKTLLDLDLPIHSKTFGGDRAFSQFGAGLQQASLEAGAQQASMKLLESHLKVLMEAKQLLTKLAENTDPKNATPAHFG